MISHPMRASEQLSHPSGPNDLPHARNATDVMPEVKKNRGLGHKDPPFAEADTSIPHNSHPHPHTFQE